LSNPRHLSREDVEHKLGRGDEVARGNMIRRTPMGKKRHVNPFLPIVDTSGNVLSVLLTGAVLFSSSFKLMA
jgi:hypothetical protein